MRREISSDEGLSLVEVIVAMAIVTTGLLALLGELATYIHQHSFQKSHATAVRLATGSLEHSRRLSVDDLSTLPASDTQTVPVNGVDYTRTTTVQICKAGTVGSCAPAGANDPKVARVQVSVTWQDGNGSHHVSLGSSDADGRNMLGGSTSGLVTDASGASGTSVVVSSMSVSPTTTAVDANGRPVSDITVTLLATGLSSGTTIPVTWTDDTGSHQATMSGNGVTWSVTVPAAQIKHVVDSNSTSGSVVFAATVPGVHAFPTATLTVLGPVTFNGACTVSPTPITLVPLSRLTALPEVMTCTTTGLTATDSVRATYAWKSSTATVNLVSVNGKTWTGTIASGTSMANSGSTESFTFTATRASDSATASSSLSVALS